MGQIPFKKTMTFDYGRADPMAPGIVRLVAPNPGPFTFKGTNTYLVGGTELAVVDPGPDLEAHRAAIFASAGGRSITHILITHAHRDHSDGARTLAGLTGAKIYGYGRSPGAGSGDPSRQPAGREFVDYEFMPDVVLRHGDRVELGDFALEVLHVPGHAPDHLCFATGAGRILFSGDHVMAWNTTVIAPPEGRMSDYIRSLELLLERRDRLYLPGHGDRLEHPLRMVKAQLVHRRWREQSILGAIRDGAETIPDVVKRVYRDLDERLIKAASLSVLAHVEHLAERHLVSCELPLDLERRFSAV